MALRDKMTNEYYKILYDECYIMGDTVFVTYSKYQTPLMRQKEKERLPLFNRALQTVAAKKAEADNRLLAIYGENAEVSVESVENLKRTNAGFYSAWNDSTQLESIQNTLEGTFYKYTGVSQSTIPNFDYAKFEIDRKLVDDPIVMSRKITANCGKYNGERIDAGLFYSRLKEVLQNETEDC